MSSNAKVIMHTERSYMTSYVFHSITNTEILVQISQRPIWTFLAYDITFNMHSTLIKFEDGIIFSDLKNDFLND